MKRGETTEWVGRRKEGGKEGSKEEREGGSVTLIIQRLHNAAVDETPASPFLPLASPLSSQPPSPYPLPPNPFPLSPLVPSPSLPTAPFLSTLIPSPFPFLLPTHLPSNPYPLPLFIQLSSPLFLP